MFPEKFLVWSRLKQFTTHILIGTGLVLVVLAVVLNYFKTTQNISTEKLSNSLEQKIIKIDIEGAVEQPGVYKMANDSRTQDVLITAGGLTAKANRKYVSENINLSQKIYDGEKIYIPEISDLSNLSTLSDLVSVNTATEQELDSLPGIGLVTARKIISGRPYQSISELLEKHLVNQATFTKIKDKISL